MNASQEPIHFSAVVKLFGYSISRVNFGEVLSGQYELTVPTIAIIDGVRLVIHLKDHLPPHLHAMFAGAEAQIAIATGEVLQGSLPRAKTRAVQTWLAANREQVAYIWTEIRAKRNPGGLVE